MSKLGALAVLAAAAAHAEPRPDRTGGNWIEMEVQGVLEVDAGQSHVVVMRARDGGRLLPIWIGPSEALAINLRLARQEPPRPLTHDLLERMLTSLDARVDKVHIEDLRDHVFLGRVFLRRGGKRYALDARPSDSIALALGARVKIFAARKVLDAAGVDESEVRTREGGEPNLDVPELLRRSRQPGISL